MSKIRINVCGDDRLSSLPDELLIKILSVTESYKFVVKCSVLSTRWKDLYKSIPCLYFSEYDFYNGRDELYEDSEAFQNCATAVARHQAQVHTFSLQYIYKFRKWEWCVEHFATSHLQHFSLEPSAYPEEPIYIPPCIFSCASLVTLKLNAFNTNCLPETFQGFPNLRRFELLLDVYKSLVEWFDDLFRKCPVLEHFTLMLEFNRVELAYDHEMPLLVSFSSQSLLHLDIELMNLRDPLRIRIVAPQMLRLLFSYTGSEDDGPMVVKVVMAEASKLLQVSVPEIEGFTLDFHGLELPKLFERISYARFQGFPNLTKCEISLFNITLCADASKLLNDFFSNCSTLQYMTMLLSFQDGEGNGETHCDMPLTFSSQSVVYMNIKVKNPRRQLQMKVVAAQLQKLIVNCKQDQSTYKVAVEVEAPRLLEVSVPQNQYVTLNLHGSLFPETVEGIANAKWSTSHHHLTYLSFDDHFKRQLGVICGGFNTISRIWSLKFLELSRISASPKVVWENLLMNLPLLENLRFLTCIFKSERRTTGAYVIKGRMTKLKEMKFEGCDGLEGERELLAILLEKSPNLQMLCFTLDKQQKLKDEHFALLGRFLSPGDLLTQDDSSGKMEFKLLKGSVYKYSKG